MIILTSFFEGKGIPADEYWSGARYAPDQMKDWPVAEWAQPIYPDTGQAIKLRDFGPDPLMGYHDYMVNLYRSRWPEMKEWLDNRGDRTVLACWCPFTKTAKAQLDQFGTFHCHLLVIGYCLTLAGIDRIFGPKHHEKLVQY